AEEGAARLGIGLARMAPTLVLHTETGLLVATISGTTRLSLRKVKKALGLRNVALAPRDEVVAVTGAEPGTVALVNPEIPTLVDERVLAEPWVSGGGGLPACTVKMRPADVVAVTGARILDTSR
ncbi:MAG: aminoacyl-tRNA deacylase, partial [Candidatus Rokuibacteriota bacterium]